MRGILDSMVTRFFSLVVALAIAGAPAALEACQIACASTQPTPAHDMHQAHHHHSAAAAESWHEAPAPADRLSPHAPACDHNDGATILSTIAGRASDTVMLLAAPVPPFSRVVHDDAFTAGHVDRAAPPDHPGIRVASPLRI
ncbi:MAG TPA: hypothetical protein VH436_28155 [Vicinamibacterales bacterium]